MEIANGLTMTLSTDHRLRRVPLKKQLRPDLELNNNLHQPGVLPVKDNDADSLNGRLRKKYNHHSSSASASGSDISIDEDIEPEIIENVSEENKDHLDSKDSKDENDEKCENLNAKPVSKYLLLKIYSYFVLSLYFLAAKFRSTKIYA